VVKHLKDRKAITNDLEGYANVDSDCEGEPAEAEDGMSKEEENEETRAVLIAGSFSAYVRPFTPPPRLLKRRVLQLEIPFLLPLHRHDLVCSSQIARC